jgi:hypothetical protein
MARTVGIGLQDFEKIRTENCFYVDKTGFIKEWWENRDSVTLVMRPRRFGKTLNMSMLECFFSVKYAGKGEMFEGLDIWKEGKYRDLQGTYPVISFSFAMVKEADFKVARKKINGILTKLYIQNDFLRDSGLLDAKELEYFERVSDDMDDVDASLAIHRLSDFLYRYYGKKVLILLDEYDTPMQEAYVNGYWEEMVAFTRNLFNATFKTNPYMERALITGITRISKESMFSDLNNLKVVTTTSTEYATAFGFTETEVFAAMDEYGITTRDEMKGWYDGFTFGSVTDIYNPWSVLNAIKGKKYAPYWVNTSSNSLAGKLLREADEEIKKKLECLIQNESIQCVIDEEIVYNQLDTNGDAIWSLLLASGYLKVIRVFKKKTYPEDIEMSGLEDDIYELRLTNLEVRRMMRTMVKGWIDRDKNNYNGFIQALLTDDVKRMNTFINKFSLNTFSYFDAGNKPSEDSEPERFYHGFVLGLVVDLAERYTIKSNRESGFGRYDVMMIPRNRDDKAFIFEFKVKDADDDETTLEDTLKNAHAQIEKKRYAQELLASGIPAEHIRKYGFAFEGKEVLIGEG